MIEIKFKPEFGNEEHIKIVEMIGELRKKEELLAKKINEDTRIRNLTKEVKELLDQINREIQKQNALL